ncbi:MAG: hypothetical protein WC679_01375 [Bacteroidales bacterium]|jgi:hypothetical protein
MTLQKIKCFFGFHDADATHWGVVRGWVDMNCKYCSARFWQSYESQKRARLREIEHKE